ncbi:MAG: lysozyme inhibitor LprI family protein [Pseudomonadota bacterium]
MISTLLLIVQAAPIPADLPVCDQEAAERGVQQDMNICAHRDFLIADATLNAQWKVTRAKMKARDADWDGYKPDYDTRPGWFATLLEAQRAWLTYRDAQCRVDGYSARGGSLEPLLVSTCKTALTEARTHELKALVESPD